MLAELLAECEYPERVSDNRSRRESDYFGVTILAPLSYRYYARCQGPVILLPL